MPAGTFTYFSLKCIFLFSFFHYTRKVEGNVATPMTLRRLGFFDSVKT